jgi:hypothetical protein
MDAPQNRTGEIRPLDANERRVLGVLIEKAKTTPDQYPLSLNGLVVGCNQKSNRDPVMTLDEEHVMRAVARFPATGIWPTSGSASRRRNSRSSANSCCAASRPRATSAAGQAGWTRFPISTCSAASWIGSRTAGSSCGSRLPAAAGC